MKKKIKDLTLEEYHKICKEHEHYCNVCPLFKVCDNYVDNKYEENKDKEIDL